jgi:hypothetical protein
MLCNRKWKAIHPNSPDPINCRIESAWNHLQISKSPTNVDVLDGGRFAAWNSLQRCWCGIPRGEASRKGSSCLKCCQRSSTQRSTRCQRRQRSRAQSTKRCTRIIRASIIRSIPSKVNHRGISRQETAQTKHGIQSIGTHARQEAIQRHTAEAVRKERMRLLFENRF